MTSGEARAWAAGFFDGEGCCHFGTASRDYQRICVTLSQRDRRILRRFHKVVRVGKIYGPYQYPSRNNSKPASLWMATGLLRVILVKSSLWPFLGRTKRIQFTRAIKAARSYSRRTGRKI